MTYSNTILQKNTFKAIYQHIKTGTERDITSCASPDLKMTIDCFWVWSVFAAVSMSEALQSTTGSSIFVDIELQLMLWGAVVALCDTDLDLFLPPNDLLFYGMFKDHCYILIHCCEYVAYCKYCIDTIAAPNCDAGRFSNQIVNRRESCQLLSLDWTATLEDSEDAQQSVLAKRK